MHARLMQVTTKPGQTTEFVKLLTERGLPLLKQQPGFVDALALTSDTDHDQFFGITLWKSKEDAEKYMSGQGQQFLASFKPLLQQEPVIRTFNVEASLAHNVGVARAASSR
jgi:quinol monooxygenase YgiN